MNRRQQREQLNRLARTAFEAYDTYGTADQVATPPETPRRLQTWRRTVEDVLGSAVRAGLVTWGPPVPKQQPSAAEEFARAVRALLGDPVKQPTGQPVSWEALEGMLRLRLAGGSGGDPDGR